MDKEATEEVPIYLKPVPWWVEWNFGLVVAVTSGGAFAISPLIALLMCTAGWFWHSAAMSHESHRKIMRLFDEKHDMTDKYLSERFRNLISDITTATHNEEEAEVIDASEKENRN